MTAAPGPVWQGTDAYEAYMGRANLFRATGLGDVEVEAIDLPMRFRYLDDYWLPHTMSDPAVAQHNASGLDDERMAILRERLRCTLPIAADGPIDLIGRASAVRGTKRGE